METRTNLPVIVWRHRSGFIAVCSIIPKCRAMASTFAEVMKKIERRIAVRLKERTREHWDLPLTYQVGHVPANGSPLPMTRAPGAVAPSPR